jgi:translation initiation factor 2 beta subunit (eIF-2beta)/eIF-5
MGYNKRCPECDSDNTKLAKGKIYNESSLLCKDCGFSAKECLHKNKAKVKLKNEEYNKEYRVCEKCLKII